MKGTHPTWAYCHPAYDPLTTVYDLEDEYVDQQSEPCDIVISLQLKSDLTKALWVANLCLMSSNLRSTSPGSGLLDGSPCQHSLISSQQSSSK